MREGKLDLYSELGINRGATPDEIKAAHRRQARQHHPDRGGDRAKFQAIQLAYDTLKDEQKRRRYDESGEAASPSNDEAFAALAAVFNSLVDQMLADGVPIERIDMREHALKAVKARAQEVAREKGRLERARAKAKALAKRFRRKRRAKGPDMIGNVLATKERDLAEMIRKAERAAGVWSRAEKILASYEYKTDEAKASGAAWATTSSFGFVIG